MHTIHQQIIRAFLVRLQDAKHLDEAKVAELEKLLTTRPKPKADHLVKIFSQPSEGE